MDLVLITKIDVSDGFSMNDYDSGLTYLTALHDIPTPEEDQQIEFRYVIGENPHFKYN